MIRKLCAISVLSVCCAYSVKAEQALPIAEIIHSLPDVEKILPYGQIIPPVFRLPSLERSPISSDSELDEMLRKSRKSSYANSRTGLYANSAKKESIIKNPKGKITLTLFYKKTLSKAGPILSELRELGSYYPNVKITAVDFNAPQNRELAKKLLISMSPSFLIGNEVLTRSVDASQLHVRIRHMMRCGEASCTEWSDMRRY